MNEQIRKQISETIDAKLLQDHGVDLWPPHVRRLFSTKLSREELISAATEAAMNAVDYIIGERSNKGKPTMRDDTREQLSLMPNAAPAYDETRAQWFTPPLLAKRIANRFVDPHDHVVEPTAGSGSLVAACIGLARHVTAFDVDQRWVDFMRARFPYVDRLTIEQRDFLRPFDFNFRAPCVVMNPPDNAKEGIFAVDFLERAMYLATEHGSVVALVRLNTLNGSERYTRVWSRARIDDLVFLSRRPPFSGESSGGKQEWVVVRFSLKSNSVKHSRPTVEWWPESWT